MSAERKPEDTPSERPPEDLSVLGEVVSPGQIVFDAADLDDSHDHRPTRPELPSVVSPQRKIGQYTLLRQLGKGGMGVVYLARQDSLKRDVAIKIIPAGRGGDPEDLERFRREAKMAASLRHPNLVQVYDVGEERNLAYLVMEFIEGGTLHTYLARKPMDVHEAAVVLEQVARGIHFAHQQGIVHRDLKPGNILLYKEAPAKENDDAVPTAETHVLPHEPHRVTPRLAPVLRFVPKITDFGLAKDFGRHSLSGPITATGIALGTPSYMAPEQARGESARIGPCSDIYALGAILYEMLTGKPPFAGDNAMATMENVCYKRPVPPSKLRPSIPPQLEKICLKCLEKQPRRRYATAELVADELRRFIDRDGATEKIRLKMGVWMRLGPTRGKLLLAASFLLFAMLGALAWHWFADSGNSGGDASRENSVIGGGKRSQLAPDEIRLRYLLAQSLCENGDLRHGVEAFRELEKNLQLQSEDPAGNEAKVLFAALAQNRQLWDARRWSANGDIPQNEASAMRYSPSGNLLAIGDKRGGLFVWEPRPGEQEREPLFGHVPSVLPGEVTAIAWSRDGTKLAAAHPDRLEIWDTVEKKAIGQPTVLNRAGSATSIAFAPNGVDLYVGMDDGTLLSLNAATGELVEKLRHLGTKDRFFATISRDGKRVVTAGRGNEIKIWDVTKQSPTAENWPAIGGVTSLCREINGDRIWVGTSRGTWFAIDPESRRIEQGPGQGFPIGSIAASGNGMVAIAVNQADEMLRLTKGNFGEIQIWDSAHRAGAATIRFDYPITALAVSPPADQMAASDGNGRVQLFTLPMPAKRATMPMDPGENAPLVRAQFVHNGAEIVLLGRSSIRFFSATGEPRANAAKPLFDLLSGVVANDGGKVIYGGANGRLVEAEFTDGGVKTEPLLRPYPVGSRFTAIEFLTPDSVIAYSPPLRAKVGKFLDSGSFVVQFGQPDKLNPQLESLNVAANAITVVPSKSGEKTAILACQDGSVRIWNWNENKAITELRHDEPATTVAQSPAQDLIVVGCDDGSIHWWRKSAAGWTKERESAPHRGRVSALAFAGNGEILLSASFDGSARLWHAGAGLPLGPPVYHGDAIIGAAIDPAGNLAITAGADGKAILWKMAGP